MLPYSFHKVIVLWMLIGGWRPCYKMIALVEMFEKTPGSATIVIMPRRGEILEMTNHEGHSYCAKQSI